MKTFVPCTPEAVGIPSAVLTALMHRLNAMDSLNGIMIMRHGKLCHQAYWAPYPAATPHVLFSLSKSFTSSAIGMAQAEKRLRITDKISSFFPEYQHDITDPRMREVTLRHLLTMTSGHATCARDQMLADADGDWARGFLSSRLDWQPGERLAYNSAATYMLAAVIRKVTGMNVREYLMPRLFEPLGIVPGLWESCPHGIDCGGWGLYLKLEDIAKFAQLLLDRGVHEGRQLIPADYLAEATVKQADNSMNESPDWKCGYGYQFWISQHGFRGDGASGQYALVLPEYDLAIAVTSCIGDMQQILTAFWEILLPGLKALTLPDNPAAQRELQQASAGLVVKHLAGDTTRRRAGTLYRFAANAAGISSCAVEFGDRECALTFTTPRGTEQLRAGFGEFVRGSLQLTDPMPHLTAAMAAWTAENVLEIDCVCYDSTFRDLYRIDFSHPEEPITRTSRFTTFRNEFVSLRVVAQER